jgi:glycosyltransferase involved in cell wall biosynthesis
LNKRPHILKVETSFTLPIDAGDESADDQLDYHVYADVPGWWRKIEQWLRLDLYLALRAKRIARQYDLIWAGSEKVGIPLSFARLYKPLVVIAHFLESPLKAHFLRATGIAKRWAGVGFISNESRDFLIKDLCIAPDRLFQFESAKYLDKVQPAAAPTVGPLLSVGVAKRDYATLIEAVADLPGYEIEIFASSKFGDKLRVQNGREIPHWIHFADFVPDTELIRQYEAARFVIVPLKKTTHSGAGLNAVLEAGAFGKAVIATRTGGMATFVQDGETGILVPPGDSAALRSAIQKLWSQPELAHQLGLAGRRYLEAHFNPQSVRANVSAVLKQIVDRQSQV